MEHAFAAVSRPTIWQRLGFGRAGQEYFDDLEGDPRYCESRLVTETVVHLDWKDRVRLLLVGRLHVVTCSKTDVPIERAVSRARASVMQPGDR